MVGFKELLRRLQIQEQMTKQHQTRVDVSLFRLVFKCRKGKKKERKKLAQGDFLFINKGILEQFCGLRDRVHRCPGHD